MEDRSDQQSGEGSLHGTFGSEVMISAGPPCKLSGAPGVVLRFFYRSDPAYFAHDDTDVV